MRTRPQRKLSKRLGQYSNEQDEFIDYQEQQINKLKELLKNMGLCLEDHLETIKEAVK